MPQQEIDLGTRVAQSLMQEMRFLKKIREDSTLNDLIDVPTRDKLAFQVIAGEDAAKSEGSGYLSASLAGLRFCVAGGEVGKTETFDIDHTIPFKHIHEKQERLLNYLNDPSNKDFKEGFLSVDKINDYFGEEAGIVKGTKRFFKLCYNDIDNLLLLCHTCNVYKSSQESLDWFGKQEPFLGKEFLKTVEDAGGLHEGIIVSKVCKVSSNDECVNIGGIDCILTSSEAKGLGKFVNEWFNTENPDYVEGIVEAYKDIWLKLKDIYELHLRSKAAGKQEESEESKPIPTKLTDILKTAITTVERHYGIEAKHDNQVQYSSSQKTPSHSSEDDSSEGKIRIEQIDNKVRQVLSYMHKLKKIQHLIASNDPSLANKEKKRELSSLIKDLEISDLTIDTQRQIFDDITNNLNKAYSNKPPVHLSDVDIKEIIHNAAHKHSMPLKLKEAEARLEAEAQARQRADARAAAAETKAKKESEKVAALEAELNKLRQIEAARQEAVKFAQQNQGNPLIHQFSSMQTSIAHDTQSAADPPPHKKAKPDSPK